MCVTDLVRLTVVCVYLWMHGKHRHGSNIHWFYWKTWSWMKCLVSRWTIHCVEWKADVCDIIKGACPEILGKWIFFKLADMVTFPTKTSSMVEKLQICISFARNLRKQCLGYLLFYKWWKPRFLISKRGFRWFLLNYIESAHQISHIRPSKYDSTFGTKISICLKKIGGWGCGSEQAPLKGTIHHTIHTIYQLLMIYFWNKVERSPFSIKCP